MDVLLLDIAQTLEASEVRLPGGEPVVMISDPEQHGSLQREEEDGEEAFDEDNDEDEDEELPPLLVGQPSSPKRIASPTASSSPIRLEVPSKMDSITRKMDSIKIGNRRVDVNV
jgi:hypothetical protein